MKAIKRIFQTSLLLALLSCQSSENESDIIPEGELHPVKLSLTLKEQAIPFPDTRSIPILDSSEPNADTKGDDEEKGLKDLCCSIEYIVFKEGETTPCRNVTYTKEDLDFGTITDQFPQGEYNVYIIAHNSSAAKLSDTTLTFEEMSDTFFYSFYLNVVPGDDNNEAITLYRVVSKIKFVSTDNVPENAKEITIQLDKYPCQFDLITGYGTIPEETPPAFSYLLTEHIGETNLEHAFFTFVPEEETQLSATLKTVDTSEEILRERTVSGITPLANYIIQYTGRLYNPSHSDDELSISIDKNGEWAGMNNNDLED